MRHFDVGDEYVGLMGEHSFERFVSVARLRNDGNVALDFEQCGKGAQHHALIFGEHHADGFSASRVFFNGRIQLGAPLNREMVLRC